MQNLAVGSPPPTRGKLPVDGIKGDCPGITPAYAGKTRLCTWPCGRPRDHPRLRGENVSYVLDIYAGMGSPSPTRGKRHPLSDAVTCAGSPPPTRGKRFRKPLFIYRLRITPAYAGKTDFCFSRNFSAWDHPRLRGENLLGGGNMEYKLGSPPPTRGKLKDDPFAWLELRITPAYAGKTFVTCSMHGWQKDHPRLRGENRGPYGRYLCR